MNVVKTDVLIVGGGGAGSRAAIEADKVGVDTTIVCKGEYGTSGCTPNSASEWMAYGVALGLADLRDSREAHFRDIVEMGAYVCDHNLARIIAYEAPERFNELVEWGVDFLRGRDGKFRQVMSDGATYPRACGTGADTGKQIMNAVKDQVEERGIYVVENTMTVDLIGQNGAVTGAVGINLESLELTAFAANSTVIATGGHGDLYKYNVFPPGMTGDGYAMALRAGAKLVNMEFMQIGPCVVTPFKFDVGGVLWRLGPRLINGNGKEYLKQYLPSDLSIDEVHRLKSVTFPFTMRNPSGYVDIANFTEIAQGRSTESGGVAFDLSYVLSDVIEKEAAIPFKYFMSEGIDIRREPLEIAPSVQHMNGGILMNEKGETNVPGLYAAGEAAGGQHGSDRPGGNSLADCQVFGARAGRHASKRARKRSISIDIGRAGKVEDRLRSLLKSSASSLPQEKKIDVGEAVTDFREMMWRNISVVRDENSLRETHQRLLKYRELGDLWLKAHGSSLVEAVELRNMIDVGLAIAVSALTRQETRGSHYRTDYPLRNDKEWLKMIEVQMLGQGLQVNVREPNMLIHP